jgi:hypothetical protein
MCHGTTLAWCSMCVSTTASPALRFERAQAWATRFMASVVLRVKMTSRGDGAPMKRAALARASS